MDDDDSFAMGMETDSDDEQLADMEEETMIRFILEEFQEQSQQRRFKLHQERVDWIGHVKHLRHAKEFTKTYRMPYVAFKNLVSVLWDDILINETKSIVSTGGLAHPIFPELVVAIGLRWIAGSEYAALRDWSKISTTSFHRCINLFLSAVLANADPMLAITWPKTESELGRNAFGFQQKATDHIVFKHVIGAIDGILIRITQPVGVDNPRCYFSGHYECFGLNVQAVCDAELRFIYYGLGGPGAMPDINAYRILDISKAVEQLPEPYHLVGDAAYIPNNQLLTPFTGRSREHVWKDTYNFYLSQMRIRIEMAFGRLTNKWRIFRQPMQTHLAKTGRIVECAFRLHNYVINWNLGQSGSDTTDGSCNSTVIIDDSFYGNETENDGDDEPYFSSGRNPNEEEEELGAAYNNIQWTNNRRQAIVQLIQQNQWQRPGRNIERNK